MGLSFRKLFVGSCLKNPHTYQLAAVADGLLQSSRPISSIQPGEKCLFNSTQLETKTQAEW